MKRSLRGPLLFILGVTFSGFLFSLQYTRNKAYQETVELPQSNVHHKTIKGLPLNGELKKCECVSETTGEIHNFCYVDPQNSSSIGRKFDCEHLKILEKLNLVDNKGPFVDLSDSEKNAEEVVFVSATSDNHFNEASGSIAAFFKFNPTRKLILYSLGLQELYTKTLKKEYKNIEIRDFDTTGYPSYTRHWMEYRFKPLIIAEVMKEYSNIWWMDAHISVKKAGIIESMTKELAENKQGNPPVPIYFFIHASHSNFATLFPELLNYFPTNSIPLLKSESKGAQLGANTFFVSKTELTIEIFKWWILCALDKNCMNPPGAQVYCSFGKNRNEVFAKCFRFDQSVLNLLLLNQFQDHNRYFSKLEKIF